jgi:hypothetical protein
MIRVGVSIHVSRHFIDRCLKNGDTNIGNINGEANLGTTNTCLMNKLKRTGTLGKKIIIGKTTRRGESRGWNAGPASISPRARSRDTMVNSLRPRSRNTNNPKLRDRNTVVNNPMPRSRNTMVNNPTLRSRNTMVNNPTPRSNSNQTGVKDTRGTVKTIKFKDRVRAQSSKEAKRMSKEGSVRVSLSRSNRCFSSLNESTEPRGWDGVQDQGRGREASFVSSRLGGLKVSVTE